MSVLGSYGPSESRWGWPTEFQSIDPDHIVITAYNIPPSIGEVKATEITYTRIPA